jgi:hypothetical protein
MNDQQIFTGVILLVVVGLIASPICILLARATRHALFAGIIGAVVGALSGVIHARVFGFNVAVFASASGAVGAIAGLLALLRNLVGNVVSGLLFGAVVGSLSGALGGVVGGLLTSPWKRWRSVIVADDCNDIRLLRRALKSKSEYQRWRAIERLGQLGADAQQALPDLVPFIDGPVVSHRIAAIDAIARIGAATEAAIQDPNKALQCEDAR